jgi:LPXTG-motif cell wall-anchored protein
MKLIKMLGALAALVAALIAVAAMGATPPASATELPPLDELPITAPCDEDGVDCGDFPAPEDVPEDSDCTVTLDGVTYEGKTNDHGQCVCPDDEPEPTTTTSTVPEPTTTTVAEPTTTTVGETTTTTAGATTTVVPDDTTTTLPGASADQGGGAPFEYDNCADVATDRSTPILANEAGFSDRLDNDGDGVGCESGEAAGDTPDVDQASATGQLPRTGTSSTGVLVVAGGVLVALGLAAVTGRRYLASRAT